jgi:uncharacterized membrane protein
MSEYFEQVQFTISVLVGAIFSLVGFITYKFSPKKINHLYGYRTPLSMQSQEHWDYAQKISAKKMIQIGLFLIIFGLLSLFFTVSDVFALALPLLLIFGTVIYLFISVERALKKKFPKR